MQQFICPNCGADDFEYKDGYRICHYCNSKYKLEEEKKSVTKAVISLDKDIENLLEKCKMDPSHARRYANLILDIDPTNSEAKKYL